jgi:Na+/melibiose symporter-like transporter
MYVPPPAKLDLRTKLAYGVGSVAFGIKDNGFAFFLLLFYDQVLGVPQQQVGFAIMLALIADGLADPLVGWLSDHWRSSWGRRHPFMYGSAIPIAIAWWLLWNPPAGFSPGALFAWLLVLAVLVRTFLTFYELPSTALAAELTADYDERTKLLAFRYFFGWWGGLTMGVVAYVMWLQPDASGGAGVLNREGYASYGTVAAIAMTASILISAAGTHRHIPRLRQAPIVPATFAMAVAEFREVLANPSSRALFLMAIFGAMASGLSSSLYVYFGTYYWELSSTEIAMVFMGAYLSALAALMIAPGVAARLGKKRAAIATATTALVLGPMPITLRLLGLFPANGAPALVPLLALFTTVNVTLLISAEIFLSSMVADVVEDSERETGRRSEGIFFAARTFAAKLVSGMGVFLSSVLLAAVGFPQGAQPGEVDPQVIRNLGLVYVPSVVSLYAIAIWCIRGYRIDRRGHEENLRVVAARGAAAPAD